MTYYMFITSSAHHINVILDAHHPVIYPPILIPIHNP